MHSWCEASRVAPGAQPRTRRHPLSDAALKQREIEALKSAGDNGSLIVVPQGTDNILSLPGTSGSKSK
ncbi:MULTISPECIES: hypothetical protein [Curtobacterium]|uniref:hypothetical protein n=1 Tax=Curtobacterium TaxID=2034 RepID=UPI001599FF05|nr:hypothetical protein [Curtobacterium flaccumfaciens]MBT1631000.1 hypothetical protein [Curtobacterium flaccumfaciens pv. oortii]MCS5520205.1 hypothetical protein [Curtobacterium flaccumfaciens]MCX2846980.1 hypothetical protein [Curtobacterium flaccumfaciens pv. oortii]QKS87113.1 hypothetical protein FK523_05905 [Curtobacterium flaccumfaciens pv. flaccumfaciens]UWD83879.1 hypothetical protein NY057_06450 [Curtobacterium flaccumfaciens]